MKGRETLGILLAGSILGGAFLLNALLRINTESNSFIFGLNCIEAIVINEAFPEDGGIDITLLGKAGGVAIYVVLALIFTILEGGEALDIFGAGLKRLTAMLLNAFLGSEQCEGR